MADDPPRNIDEMEQERPYPGRLKRSTYEADLRNLQIELLKVQRWSKDSNQRIVIIFEGRDAAGKGGAIKRFTQNLNPRGGRVVALTKPDETERHQWYFQRYVAHLPTAGEIVMFDRSWYNRAGVERVLGFCTDEEYAEFMVQAPTFERALVRSGIHLRKLWFSVSRDRQDRRFEARKADPLRRWKFSPIDELSQSRFDDYTMARDVMLAATDTVVAPWMVVNSNEKRRARLESIRSVLHGLDYEHKDHDVARPPDPHVVRSAADLMAPAVDDGGGDGGGKGRKKGAKGSLSEERED